MEQIIEIEKIVAGGKGLARPGAGKVVMVPFVLPAETVRICPVKELSHYIQGQLLEVLAPAAGRITAKCPFYGDCGGCDLQHAGYEHQLQIKQNIVHEALQRAKVPLSDGCLKQILASPHQWGYRNRVRLKIDRNGLPGFFKKKSNQPVPVNSCLLATARINEVISELQTTGVFKECAALCNEIELLQSPVDSKISLLLSGVKRTKALQKQAEILARRLDITAIGCSTGQSYHQLVPEHTPALLSQQLNNPDGTSSCTLSWSAGCFSQVNALQNKQLIQLVLRLAGNVKNTSILDLYCGMGNFSIPLALQGAAVTGIERSTESIKWAKFNGEAANVVCSFFAADVSTSLQQLVRDRQQVETILLDPPRRGIGKEAALLCQLQPRRIIYISCDPAALARDLATLCGRGYTLDQLIAVDMFPQTHHIETVALLKKN
jgi:23S rRNA (uracil1939-C5)-methyltransferase